MLLHYFIAGGIFMWGILLASICGVAVILEKLWIFSTKEREFTKEYRKQLFKALKTESREKIIEIVEGRNKNKVHNGPRKNGNPEFPLGKLVRHVNCSKKHTKYNIFVDLNQSNGKKKNDRIYKKYRCRGCYFSLPKEDMERQIGEICGKIEMTERGRNAFSCALDDV